MHFNLSQLGKNLLNIGTSLTQTGMAYGIMKDNMRGGSVFGGGYGGGCGMGGFMGGGMSPFSMMGQMNSCMMNNYAPYGMGGMGSDYASGYGIGMAGGSAYAQGVQDRMMIEQQRMATGQVKTNAPKAKKVSADQDLTLGKAFEAKQKEMISTEEGSEGEAVEGKKFKFVTDAWEKLHNKNKKSKADKKKEAKEYKSQISNFSKSYLMMMDKEAGNGNGEVSQAEFVKFAMKDLDKDATKEQRAEAKQAALNMFNKLNQNGDKVLDWKETAAMMWTLDKGTDKTDGVIESEDFASFSTLGVSPQVNVEDQQLRKGYNMLFGSERQQ